MSKKMGKRLMGICGVAVTAIYAAGYVYTMPSAQASASSTPPFSTSSSPSTSTATSTHNTSSSSGSHQGTKSNKSASTNPSSKSGSTAQKSKSSSTSTSKSSSTSSKPKAAAKAKYKDGTYTGSGSNPYGTLSVSLKVQNGKISSVNITQYMMHYPQSFIDPQLPKEVVSMQTWRIYIVSGATASTYNFAEAVYAALKKAKA